MARLLGHAWEVDIYGEAAKHAESAAARVCTTQKPRTTRSAISSIATAEGLPGRRLRRTASRNPSRRSISSPWEPKRENLHAADKGIGHARKEAEVGRPGQQETARPSVAVHRRRYGQEQFRHALDLVDDDLSLEPIEEGGRVSLGGGKHRRIVQGEVAIFREQGLSQRALAYLAGAGEEHHRGVRQGSLRGPSIHLRSTRTTGIFDPSGGNPR